MSAPREFTMKFNFKLVYTTIVYTIGISSNASLHDLFDEASVKFEPYINYHNYYIDYVIAGQDKDELAPAIWHLNLHQPLCYEFGDKWRQISFYVRPINRNDEIFHRMDNYNIPTLEGLQPETPAQDTHIPETQSPEIESRPTDILGLNLPPPPGLTRHVVREIFV